MTFDEYVKHGCPPLIYACGAWACYHFTREAARSCPRGELARAVDMRTGPARLSDDPLAIDADAVERVVTDSGMTPDMWRLLAILCEGVVPFGPRDAGEIRWYETFGQENGPLRGTVLWELAQRGLAEVLNSGHYLPTTLGRLALELHRLVKHESQSPPLPG